eukprot:4529583-Amphidinium_carterae.1
MASPAAAVPRPARTRPGGNQRALAASLRTPSTRNPAPPSPQQQPPPPAASQQQQTAAGRQQQQQTPTAPPEMAAPMVSTPRGT